MFSGMAKFLWDQNKLGKDVAETCEKYTLLKSSFLRGKKV